MVEFSAAGDKSDTESDDSGAEGLSIASLFLSVCVAEMYFLRSLN